MSKNNLICVLYGNSNTGKTTSLRLLAKKLEQITIPSITIPNKDDFVVTFILKNKKIGIITGGDDRGAIESGLTQINNNRRCDIIFCASRTKGQTTNFLNKTFKNEELRWITNMYIYGNNDEQAFLCNQSVSDFLYNSLLLELAV
ncbi:hypothetical protein UB37_16065 [Photobacterium iliopiscarium]|uniref:G domain-containing protein n=1 Tax=Photobacterium iliopiscarium TaxID=56192 RepID=A0ABX5GNX9_9GAMM|nr:ATP-binding protein [Photobacterium iliopiscarium]KJG19946.1 hypothetical protein UB37_16065 [Photobacterium iliopiscarium]PSW92634.1 hypothetical protein C9J52_17295 [Photobacterium iliopiscarium]